MDITVPILIRQVLLPDGKDKVYQVRHLFLESPLQQDRKLPLAMNRLERDLEGLLRTLTENNAHDAIAGLAWYPSLTERNLTLAIELKKGLFRVTYHFALLQSLGRTLAFVPALPELWFDVPDMTSFPARAETMVTAWFKKQEKDETLTETPEAFANVGSAWIAALNLSVPPPRPRKKQKPPFAFLGAPEKLDGGAELEKVGRNLSRLPDEELGKAVLRDREVLELERLLLQPERRPLLLVGPPGSGKTALLYELIRRRRQKPVGTPLIGDLYLMAPQRLISGMMYVGQWEERLLAILKHMRRKDLIFYVDDLPGLLHAGTSASSNLTVCTVLQPWLERKDVRFVGEITPEALRVMREQARSLVDLCHLIPVHPTTDLETQRILIQLMSELEAQHKCLINPMVIPTILELQRRFEPTAAFPGKAARLLRQVAARPDVRVDVSDVFLALQNRTGLRLEVMIQHANLTRAAILSVLKAGVIGQEAALEALADVVSIFRARLNDTSRPVANLLFLGPTGVGKTETAKALARWLYGENADLTNPPLLRFDLNEFGGGDAVSRLVGTVDEPEGLLTGAIRRRPFAVVLFDEIEKAHPSVFNLLLQLLGEGRLTDARGRTADFTNAIILMTSNLGVREATRQTGFDAQGADVRQVFIKAAEAFFSPEFFNRIDRVIPFTHLSQEELRQLIRLEVSSILQREGMQRRRLSLQVDPLALDWLVAQGYHPSLGARALKRVLERELVRPLAEALSAVQSRHPLLARAFKGPRGLLLDVRPLEAVASLADANADTEIDDLVLKRRLLTLAQRLCDEATTRLVSLPYSPASSSRVVWTDRRESPSPEAEDLLEVRSSLRDCIDSLTLELEARNQDDEIDVRGVKVRNQVPRRRRLDRWTFGHSLDDICAADDMRDALRDIFEQRIRRGKEDRWPMTAYAVSLAELTLRALSERWPQQALSFGNTLSLLNIEVPDLPSYQLAMASPAHPHQYEPLEPTKAGRIETEMFEEGLSRTWKEKPFIPDPQQDEQVALLTSGPLSSHIARGMEGFVLRVYPTHFQLEETVVVTPEPGESLADTLMHRRARIEAWKLALARGEVGFADEPYPPGRLRAIMQDDNCLSLATGEAYPLLRRAFSRMARETLLYSDTLRSIWRPGPDQPESSSPKG